jgi:beta-lactamase regulating signal transducer with metallopeptidase domain
MSESKLRALDSLAAAWGDWMWSMSWQLTLLVSVLFLLDRLLAGYSARLRFTLWLLALVRLLIPPDFAAPTGAAWWLGDHLRATTESISTTLGDWLAGPVDAPIAAAGNASTVAAAHRGETSVAATGQQALQSGSAEAWRGWTSILFLVWFGIVSARLSFLTAAWMQIRKWLRSATPIVDREMMVLLASAQARVGLQRPIELCDSHACTTPLVTGWRRPVVLLPTTVRESFSRAELEAVLVHELAHVARGDSWVRLAQALLSSVYFFHPALWLANWFLRRTCEDACDEQTIAAFAGRRRCYAEAIVKAATVVGYQPPTMALRMLDDGYPVKRRLERILDPHLRFAAGGSRVRGLVAVVAALVLIPSGQPDPLASDLRSVQVSSLRQPARGIENASPEQAENPQPAALPGQQPEQPLPSERMPSKQIPSADAQQQLRLETEALAQLDSPVFEERMAGYATLAAVGTERSFDRLERAFFERSGLEQDAAKRALDAVWKQFRSTRSEPSAAPRLFQSPQEN